MSININELNKRISIAGNTILYDDDGFEIESETVIAEVWAKISNVSGSEMIKNNTDFSKKRTRFLIRYRKDIEFNTSMQIKFNNKSYNIVYINNYNYLNDFLEIIGEVVENV